MRQVVGNEGRDSRQVREEKVGEVRNLKVGKTRSGKLGGIIEWVKVRGNNRREGRGHKERG